MNNKINYNIINYSLIVVTIAMIALVIFLYNHDQDIKTKEAGIKIVNMCGKLDNLYAISGNLDALDSIRNQCDQLGGLKN